MAKIELSGKSIAMGRNGLYRPQSADIWEWNQLGEHLIYVNFNSKRGVASCHLELTPRDFKALRSLFRSYRPERVVPRPASKNTTTP